MKLNLLNFEEKIPLANVLLVSKYIKNSLPPVFGIPHSFVLKFTTMNQSLNLLINCLKPHSELYNSYAKTSTIKVSAINS